jgi:hypothetical protein
MGKFPQSPRRVNPAGNEGRLNRFIRAMNIHEYSLQTMKVAWLQALTENTKIHGYMGIGFCSKRV